MTPERWQQVKDVLATALDLAPDRRSSYLDQACLGDSSLRNEVELLLLDEQKVSSQFLGDTALAESAAVIFPHEANPWIGRLVGAYRIVEQIGAGGMGEVYRGFRDDDQFRKDVALKVVRAGQDSAFVISRFRNERQILASLDHPNIARLLDGGTTEEGLPFFVMELIEGQPITEYCDQRRLSISDRLRLFSKVCAAVQYAHQHLIIHRDIKPGNILVTVDGTPKLLDFGIAKILDLDSVSSSFDATLTAFRVLTPGYASPEQINGEAMTTASDVYSLGVVLYELLTGRSPYRTTTTPQEIAVAVCRSELQKPSSSVRRADAPGEPASKPITVETRASQRGTSPEKLYRGLTGDLDNIVLMALRKEPSRRYSSVGHLQEDIRRHLESVPVLARNDTVWYRTSKFVRRHRAGAAASMAVVLALAFGVTVALYEAHIARQQAEIARVQRTRAERRFNDVRKLASSLMFEVHDSIRDLPGAMSARKLLVNRALEYLDSLSQEAAGDTALLQELAAAYDRVGDLLGYSGAANLGDYAGALQSYHKALAIREAAASANPNELPIQGDLLNDYFRLSFTLNDAGDQAGALDNLNKGIAVAQRIVAAHPDPRYQDWLAGFFWQNGNILLQLGRNNDALNSYRHALSIRENIASAGKADPMIRTHLAADYIAIGKALSTLGDTDHALDPSKKGTDLLEQLSRADPTNATLKEYLAEAYGLLAAACNKHRDHYQSLEYFRKARDGFAELSRSNPTDSLARDNVALVDVDIGDVLLSQGKIGPGIQLLRNANAVLEKIEHKNRYQIAALAESDSSLGRGYLSRAEKAATATRKMEDLREAQSWYQKSLAVRQEMASRNATVPQEDGETRESILQQLAKCEAALAKLNARHETPPSPVRSSRGAIH